jgi:hypothetical protein
MTILSNVYMFPLLQIIVLIFLIFALQKDFRARKSSAFDGSEVIRGANSMTSLEKVTGLAISIVIAFINNDVFSDKEYWATNHSVFINLFDFLSIIYVCYISGWGRNLIIRMSSCLRKEAVS